MSDGTFLIFILALVAAAVFAYQYMTLSKRLNEEVQSRVSVWQARELASHKSQLMEVARREAAVLLEEWKRTHDKESRKDAVQRSHAVTVGKVTEHILPYLPSFDFDPRDVRFLGSPIDFVVFDGLSDGCVRRVVFVEVKTATSKLNPRERAVREAIQSRQVEWRELRRQELAKKPA
jgi:predicted Holliday junction resolvase-like endonuclease